MSEPGYVDYARINLSAGFLLSGNSLAIKTNRQIFQGYVGSWPFINFFWEAVNGPDYYRVDFTYYTDSTFANQVAFQRAIRNGNVLGYSQVAVLSPWMRVHVYAITGGSSTVLTWALYGATQSCVPAKLASLDTGTFDDDIAYPVNFNNSYIAARVIPGTMVFAVQSTGSHWYIQIQRWDFGTLGFVNHWVMDNLTSHGGGQWIIAIPDTVINISIQNNSSASQTIRSHGMMLLT